MVSPGRRRIRADAVIESWKRVLVLAPHTDDGEFGAGATMARLVEGGAEVQLPGLLDRDEVAPRRLPAGHARARGRGCNSEAWDPDRATHRARLRSADVSRAAPGHPRAADRSTRRVLARRRADAKPARHPPGPWRRRRRGPARVQAHDAARLRDPMEQPAVRLPALRAPRQGACRAEGCGRSSATRRSSTATTRTPNTSGTSRARAASISVASWRRSSRSTASSRDEAALWQHRPSSPRSRSGSGSDRTRDGQRLALRGRRRQRRLASHPDRGRRTPRVRLSRARRRTVAHRRCARAVRGRRGADRDLQRRHGDL